MLSEINGTWTMGTKQILHPPMPLVPRAWRRCLPTTAGLKDLLLTLAYLPEKKQAKDGLWADARREMWALVVSRKG